MARGLGHRAWAGGLGVGARKQIPKSDEVPSDALPPDQPGSSEEALNVFIESMFAKLNPCHLQGCETYLLTCSAG